MRLHPVTWLMIVGVMLKLGVLAITLASLVASVVYVETDGMRAEDAAFLLGVITAPMAWNLRELAETTLLVGTAFWIEALVRVHGRLQFLNTQTLGEKAHA
jgi:D-arabinose 1-dehydrogenase-like Zn-dependent alcohol dehydrogenase